MVYFFPRKLLSLRKFQCQNTLQKTSCFGHGPKMGNTPTNSDINSWRVRLMRKWLKQHRMKTEISGSASGLCKFQTRLETSCGELVMIPSLRKQIWGGDTSRTAHCANNAWGRRKTRYMHYGHAVNLTRYGQNRSGTFVKFYTPQTPRHCYHGYSITKASQSFLQWQRGEYGTSKTRFASINFAAHRTRSHHRRKRGYKNLLLRSHLSHQERRGPGRNGSHLMRAASK